MPKVPVLVVGTLPAQTEARLGKLVACHRVAVDGDPEPALARVGHTIRGIARGGGHADVGRALIERLPKLEIIANFGVGYDGIDLKTSAARGVVVTNTPDVLTEEVADTALALLLMTVRELSAAERYLRAGKWTAGGYPLSRATLRDRTVGIAGLGRIGMTIARRLEVMNVKVAYHSRHKRPDVPWPYHSELRALAKAVDVLLVVLPGGPETRNAIDARVLAALGPEGILINIGRGSVVDEQALVAALKGGKLLAAGLDVFADEPHVPAELLAFDNVVLLPHVGSASEFTRDAMGQLMIDNLKSWFGEGKPLTPVPETPWPRP